MIGGSGKWVLALVASIAMHASAAAWFYQASDEEQVEGGAPAQISMLGDAFQDEIAAGNPTKVVEPTPTETVDTSEAEITEAQEDVVEDALSEPVETIEPVTSPTAETQLVNDQTPENDPVDTTPQMASATQVAQTHPQTAAVFEAQTTVEQTSEIQLAEINIASLQTEQSISEVAQQEPVLTTEPVKSEEITEPKKPVEVTKPEKPVKVTKPEVPQKTVKPEPEVRKKKPVTRAKKKPAKKKKRAEKKKRKKKAANNSGSGGKAKKNIRAGSNNGSKKAARNSGKSNGKKSRKAGNASASNYKGKVRRKVRRSFRRPRKGKRLRSDAVVRFVLSKSGSVRSVKLVRSSGSPKLDKAALTAVRRASPFPKPPGNLGGRGLDFTIPFGA